MDYMLKAIILFKLFHDHFLPEKTKFHSTEIAVLRDEI